MSAPGRSGRDPVGWLVRVAWGRRLETGLTFAIVVARVSLVVTLGVSIARVVLFVIGLVIIATAVWGFIVIVSK